jgi:uncharacterized protein YndB with AHSA1/START domain
MAQIERSIFIKAPLEQVFDYATNPDNQPSWARDVIDVKRRSPGPVAVGTTWIQVVTGFFMAQQALGKVIEYEPPHRFAQQLTYGRRSSTTIFKFEPKDNGTKLTMIAPSTPQGALGRFVSTLFGEGLIGRLLEHDLKSLKKVLEQGA